MTNVATYQIIVLPWWANCFNRLIHWNDMDESKPVVGSSKNITGGLLTSSRAIANRLSWPPDSWPVSVFLAFSRPIAFIIPSI